MVDAREHTDRTSAAALPSLGDPLAEHPMLAGLDFEILDALRQELDWFSLAGGTILFREGDPGDSLYLVTSGALAVTVRQRDGTETTVARIRAGETVGEMALISGAARSATAITLRDCSLLRMSKVTFDRLIERHPKAALHLMALLTRRLVHTTRGTGVSTLCRTLALVPATPSVPCAELAAGLADHMTPAGRRILVLDAGEAERTAEWFHTIERAHDLILYRADSVASPWSQLCLRQADRLLLVSEAGASGRPDCLPAGGLPRRPCDHVILHTKTSSEPPAPTALDDVPVELTCHVRPNNQADLARLARLLTGRAVGWVLSSGGARGFAHLGAVRALRAAGIPCDLLGGTSMGAIIAAGAALEWDDAELEERMRAAFVSTNPMRDYTLPLVALVRGQEVTRRLRAHFGEVDIENLWRPFFCVSSNLTTANTMIHRNGPLWRALRASVAIPGLLPPVVENGEILVDGGVIEGFPTGTMRAMSRGPVVGVNVSADQAMADVPQALESGSPWWLLRRGERRAPGIVSLLMRAGTISSDALARADRSRVDLLLEPPVAQVDLLDWGSFRRAIEIGYDHTMRTLERLETPLVPG